MTHLTHLFFLGVLLIVFETSVAGQEQTTAPRDLWRGLTLDESTPEDAIRVLGLPSSDKDHQGLQILMVDKWLTSRKHKQKIFRTLTFDKPRGLAKARFSFLENRLVMIELAFRTGDVPDWFDADDLSGFFDIKFTYQEWHIGKRMPPQQDFQAKAENPPPKDFAELYDMIAISERSFIIARVDNITARPMGLFTRGCSWCANEKNEKKKARDVGGIFPGQVSLIQIVSRRLEG